MTGIEPIELLLAGLFLLTGILFLQMGIALTTRWVKIIKKWYRENRFMVHTAFFVGYLSETIPFEKISNLVANQRSSIPYYIDICRDLQKNLKGSDKQKIQRFLMLPIIKDYYEELMASGSEKKVVEALLYYRELDHLEPEELNRIETYLTHTKTYMVHIAAGALMACPKVEDRGKALRHISMRREVTRLAMFELLYKFRKRDKEQWIEEGNYLLELLKDPNVLKQHKATIAIAMGGMGYFYQSRNLLDVLQTVSLLGDNDELIAGLIEGLGMLHNPKTVTEIQRMVLSTGNPRIMTACIRALRRIDGQEAVRLLFRFLSKKYDLQIQVEAAIQIIKLDAIFMEWVTRDLFPKDVNPEIARQISDEIGDQFLLNEI